MLWELWHFVNVATIKSIYYAILHSHICLVLHGVKIWTLNITLKKAIQIIGFASFSAHTLQIFAELKVIRFADLISFVYLTLNILWVSLPQFFRMFSFWHLILMNKTLGQHHKIFWQNHLAILQSMTQMSLLLLV